MYLHDSSASADYEFFHKDLTADATEQAAGQVLNLEAGDSIKAQTEVANTKRCYKLCFNRQITGEWIMAHEDLLKIDCTTTVVIRNTRTNKIYKDEAEKEADIADPNTETTAEHIAQDVKVEVSPKGLNVLQKVMNQNNDKPKS
jgi:predicted membrane GTPase involved in stress response